MTNAPISFSSEGSYDPDGSISKYVWDFGDGSSSAEENPTHNYTDPGSYTVRLTLTDNKNLVSYVTTSCSVSPQAPVADSGGPYSAGIMDPVDFDSSGSYDPDGNITKYEWDFGDGSSSVEANPTHVYTSLGNFTVTLDVTDNHNAVGAETTWCRVIANPPVAVAGGPYSGVRNETITFDGSGSYDPDGEVVMWRWDFGDGTPRVWQKIVNHTYTELGNFTVQLRVKDNDDAAVNGYTWCFISTIPPVANASGPYYGVAADTISFDSSSSFDADGNITAYNWEFGDGINSTDANPTHVYALKGNYTVTLTVLDNNNATAVYTTWIEVAPRPPVAEANGPYSGLTGTPIPFSSAGSNDVDGSIVEFRWSFGDDSGSSLEENPSHTYSDPGTYTVSLMVTDEDGLTHTDTATCSVELPPNVLPTANANGPYDAKVKETVSFSSAGSDDTDGEIVSYEWSFGDGSPVSSEANPTHEYASEGTYTVTLTVTDDREGVDTAEAVCTISKKPFPILPLAGLLVAVGAGAAYYFLVMKKQPKEKPPKPSSIRVTADPFELPADGRSTATVKVELLDEKGAPIAAAEETEISLSATLGTMADSMRIGKGQSSGTATLTSGLEVGSFRVSAEARGLRTGSLSLTFTEKRRYCMHCGTKMSVEDNVCPKCGLMPPSGVDVKECNNCGEVIPSVAKYCRECGAMQPIEGEEVE